MHWSPKSATNAYLDALKLCSRCQRECSSCEPQIPESNEFISALAAGMSAKLIVEVTSEVSPSTLALAVAARQTGGKLVCIIPEADSPNPSRQAIHDSGLGDRVEFRVTGDPAEALVSYDNIDFSLVDCKSLNHGRLLGSLAVNPKQSVVVASNLLEGEKGFGPGHLRGVEGETRVRSMKHPIGRGMEITMIGRSNDYGRRMKSKSGGDFVGRSDRKAGGGAHVRRTDRSRWVFELDEKSGEEHIFRMPKSRSEVFEVKNQV